MPWRDQLTGVRNKLEKLSPTPPNKDQKEKKYIPALENGRGGVVWLAQEPVDKLFFLGGKKSLIKRKRQ